MAATDKESGVDGRCLWGDTATITDASHDAGTVTVTATAHGFSANDRVQIESVVGMTDLNDTFNIVATPTADTFTVSLTTAQSYTSGGTARRRMEIFEWHLEVTTGIIDVTDSSSSSWKEKLPSGWWWIPAKSPLNLF